MSRKEKNKKAKKKKIAVCFIIICVLIIIFALYHIIKWFIFNKDNSEIQDKIEEMITIEKDPENIGEEKYVVDFEKLKEQNPDVVAYIKVPNTKIEYVIVKTKNNSYYLNHNFDKKWNSAGWIFADYRNKIDGSDKNIILYGHNSRNGSMFGTLRDTLKKEWYKNEENQKIKFITEQGEFIYQVFSIYSIRSEDYYIQTNFKNDKEYLKFLKTIKSRSRAKFDVELNKEDKILTLSSCMPGGKDRVVLHARKSE